MHDQHHLLRFSIGPVQPFIECARTLRDLWTGSYLLSWLTARAVAEVRAAGGEPLGAAIADLPLVRHHLDLLAAPTGAVPDERSQAALRRSCVPNVFLAWYDGRRCPDLPARLEGAVREEWRRIGDSVHDALHKRLKTVPPSEGDLVRDWDRGWRRQLSGHWDLRVLVQPPGTDWLGIASELRIPRRAGGDRDLLRVDILGSLAEAQKLIRHVRPSAERMDHRPKCQLTGEDEQMGGVHLSREGREAFWRLLTGQPLAGGERLRERERLGAPALVKRMAWACALSNSIDQDPRSARNRDTATVAASAWLRAAGLWEDLDRHGWSGQWLHAGDRSDPGEVAPLPAVQQRLREVQGRSGLGPPPRYYAVLMMDGDGVGLILSGAQTPASLDEIAGQLSNFALHRVPDLIAEFLGGDIDLNQPVYAGGDDVLALLPLIVPRNDGTIRTVIDLARGIANAFGDLKLDGANRPTMSAGLAVVHYKQDLRLAIQAARDAEQAAKRAGKNRLAISIVRRSGEHSTAIAHWDQAPTISNLVGTFCGSTATDRWTYQLRSELGALPDADAVDVELARLLSRSRDRMAPEHGFHEAWERLKSPRNGSCDTDPMKSRHNALGLIQSASFIARGSREDQ